MKKRIVIITLVLMIILSVKCLGVSEETFEFQDISKTDWYYEDVITSNSLGLMIGRTNSTFEPHGQVTVAEAVTVASRILDKQTVEKLSSDTSRELWYESYVQYALEEEIIYDNEFQNYNENITRVDVAKVFSRVLRRTDYTVINEIDIIPDVSAKQPSYEDVILLYQVGILVGTDEYGTFCPNQYITRAEFAAIINRISIESKRIKIENYEHLRYLTVKQKIEADGGDSIFVSHEQFNVSESLLTQLQDEINRFGQKCSFYLVTLDGKFSIGYNIDSAFHSASTVKAPYSLYSVKKIESGDASLEEIMVYEQKYNCGQWGVIMLQPYGTEYTIDSVLYNTIHYSDNNGYYMLQDRFPIAGYNEFLTSIDCSRMKLEGGIRWGWVYAREAVKIWNEIYHYANTSNYGDMLWQLFVNAEYNFIKDALESKYGTLSYDVAHKSGFNSNGRNDEAIVMGEVPYILVVCTKPNGKEKEYLKNTTILLQQVIEEYAQYTN